MRISRLDVNEFNIICDAIICDINLDDQVDKLLNIFHDKLDVNKYKNDTLKKSKKIKLIMSDLVNIDTLNKTSINIEDIPSDLAGPRLSKIIRKYRKNHLKDQINQPGNLKQKLDSINKDKILLQKCDDLYSNECVNEIMVSNNTIEILIKCKPDDELLNLVDIIAKENDCHFHITYGETIPYKL